MHLGVAKKHLNIFEELIILNSGFTTTHKASQTRDEKMNCPCGLAYCAKDCRLLLHIINPRQSGLVLGYRPPRNNYARQKMRQTVN